MPDEEPRIGGAGIPVGGTGNMSYKRSVLVETGGFDESFPMAAGEDADLQERVASAGYTLVLMPLKVDHIQKYHFDQFIEENIRRGRGVYHFKKKRQVARSGPRIVLGMLGAPIVGLRHCIDGRTLLMGLLSGIAHALRGFGEFKETLGNE